MSERYVLDLDNPTNSTALIKPGVVLACAMQQMLHIAFKPALESLSVSLAEMNKSLINSFSLRLFPQGYPLPGITQTSVSENGTDEGRDEVISRFLEAPTFRPTLITDTTIVKPQTKSSVGLSMIAGGSFQHRGKTLENISLDSKHGRVLALFHSGKDHFILDTTIYEGLDIYDSRDFSWVLRNLKRAFRKNNLQIIIERRKTPVKGYILIEIQDLH